MWYLYHITYRPHFFEKKKESHRIHTSLIFVKKKRNYLDIMYNSLKTMNKNAHDYSPTKYL